MRTLPEFLAEYRKSHLNPVNIAIHVVCVPVIFFCTLGLLWGMPVGRWLGLDAAVATWVNGATLFAVPAMAFYARMSLRSLLAMTLWFALSLWGILAMEAAALPLGWICAGVWLAAWVGQFYGHKVEGAKPSFADDLIFLLVGPLFVMEKLYRQPQGRVAG